MRRMWAASLVVLGLAGCGAPPAGGGGGPTPGPTPPPTLPAMSGDWTLVHTLNPLAGRGGPTALSGTLRLLQNGTTLIGTYTPAQAPTAVAVSGTLSGLQLRLQIGPVTVSSGVTLNLLDTGTLAGTARAASGSTAVTATLDGTTLQASGSFMMTRQ